MFTAWLLAALIAAILGVRIVLSHPGDLLPVAFCLVAVWQVVVLVVFPTPSGKTPCAEHATAGGVRTPIFHGGKAAVGLEGPAAAPCVFRAQQAAESDRRGVSFPTAQPGAVLASKVVSTVAVWVAQRFHTGTTTPEIDFTLPVDAVDFLTWEDAK